MTGFSSGIITLPAPKNKITAKFGKDIQLTMTLKTLNSRFFEATCKMPYSLNHLETELIKLFKSKLYRGNVFFSIHMHNPSALTTTIEPSLNVVEGYIKAIEQIKKQFNIEGSINVKDIISLPEIFETEEAQIGEELTVQIIKAVNDLIEALNQTRIKEGENLAQDLSERIKHIREFLKQLEPRADKVMELRKQQIFETLKTILPEGQETPTEVQSLALHNQLDRIDIHEEIVRFKSHLEELEVAIKSTDKEKGKKLDFTLQELFREINTITSKCSDAEISRLAINIKVELEKAREQTQNIV